MTGSLRLHVQPAIPGSPLLLAFEGWNDAGEAATSAVAYLERALGAVPLGEIDCEEFGDAVAASLEPPIDRKTHYGRPSVTSPAFFRILPFGHGNARMSWLQSS